MSDPSLPESPVEEERKREPARKQLASEVDEDWDEPAPPRAVEPEEDEPTRSPRAWASVPAAVGLVAIVLLVGLSIYGMSTPEPDEVCDHVMSLFVAEFGVGLNGEDLERSRHRCIEDIEHRRERKGSKAYTSEARCVLDANDLNALAACESD